MYAVRTGSMAPTSPVGTLVVDAPPSRTAAVGEVITFQTVRGLVTHRVAGTNPSGVTTKGDANPTPDAWTVDPRHVVGVVQTGIAGAGHLLVFFQQPTGALSLVLLGMNVLFAWSLFFSRPQPTTA